jgi:hypothetical protein
VERTNKKVKTFSSAWPPMWNRPNAAAAAAKSHTTRALRFRKPHAYQSVVLTPPWPWRVCSAQYIEIDQNVVLKNRQKPKPVRFGNIFPACDARQMSCDPRGSFVHPRIGPPRLDNRHTMTPIEVLGEAGFRRSMLIYLGFHGEDCHRFLRHPNDLR